MRAMPAVAAALLTVSLALAGCSAGGASDTGGNKSAARAADGAQGYEGGGAQDAATGAPGGKGKAADTRTPTSAGTHVIRTAELTVQVKSAQKALGTARTAAENAGGWCRTRPPSGSRTTR